jgi:hypothetical protein
MTYANSGSFGTNDLTPVRTAPSGMPAKNRGLYFDGSSQAYIPVANCILSHTFSVHFWALAKDGADHTLFSKDRDTAVAGELPLLQLAISNDLSGNPNLKA